MKTAKCSLPTIENIKRCYVDHVFKAKCEKCGDMVETDLNNNYFMNPSIGSEQFVEFYCEKCDFDFNFPVKIKSATIEIEYNF